VGKREHFWTLGRS